MKLSKYIAELEETQVTMAESIKLQKELSETVPQPFSTRHLANVITLEHSSMIIGDIIKKLKTVEEV